MRPSCQPPPARGDRRRRRQAVAASGWLSASTSRSPSERRPTIATRPVAHGLHALGHRHAHERSGCRTQSLRAPDAVLGRRPRAARRRGHPPSRSPEGHGVDERLARAAAEVRRHGVRARRRRGRASAAHVARRVAGSSRSRWASVVSGVADASTRPMLRCRVDVARARATSSASATSTWRGPRSDLNAVYQLVPSLCGPRPKSRPRPQYSPSRAREATLGNNAADGEHGRDAASAGAPQPARRTTLCTPSAPTTSSSPSADRRRRRAR